VQLRIAIHVVSITPALVFEILFVFAEAAVEMHPAAAAVSVTVLLVTAFIAVLRYFLIRLDYDMRYYVVTDRSLRIRQGALTIQESTYTFANVQNLTIRQGPMERLFGISNLHVETAGGAAASQSEEPGGTHHHGVLAGIDNAPEVRDRILTLLRAYRDAGLGDREDPPKAAAGRPEAPRLERLREILAELRALKGALDR
jgi:membrane protein YdbS with pleckstrin-like domain